MGADKIIAASLQLDIKGADKLSELNKGVSEVKGNLKDTGTAALKTGKDVDVSTGSFGKLKGQIGDLPGPLGQAGEGVNKLSGTFKALLLNPVVLVIALIVGALAALYKAFTSTAAGADKMEQIFAGVSAVVEVVAKRILQFAGAIVKFFTGDFKGALAQGKAAVSGFGDEVTAEFQKAADATKLLQQVEDAMRDLGVSRAKLNRDLAKTKEIISDENSGLADKLKAIDKVRLAEGAQTQQELANEAKKLEALKKKAGVDVSDEEADEIAAQTALLFQLEEKSFNDITTLNEKEKSLKKEARAKEKEEQTKAIEASKAEREKEAEFNKNLRKLEQENILLGIKDDHDKELKQLEFKFAEEKRINDQALKDRKLTLEQANQIELALTTKFNLEKDNLIAKNKEAVDKAAADKKQKDIDDKLKLDEQNAAKAKEILDGFAAAEKEHTKQLAKEAQDRIDIANLEAENRLRTFDIIGQGLSVLGGLIGKSTALGKATAVAETIINTYTAAWQAFRNAQKNPASIPFPAYPYIQAGIAIVAGLATVRSILAVKTPGGSAGGSTPSAPTPASPAAPIAPTVSTTALDQDTINRQGNAANPARVYMVEQDGANTAERISRLNRAARLGG